MDDRDGDDDVGVLACCEASMVMVWRCRKEREGDEENENGGFGDWFSGVLFLESPRGEGEIGREGKSHVPCA